jgi:anti-anti-sigma factor
MERGTIDLQRDGAISICTLRGEHDLDTAPELRSELERAAADGAAVVVDLSQVRFIDSTVLGALIFRRERRRPFALVVPPGCPAHRLCEMVELDGIVATFPSVATALSDVGGAAGHRGE